MMMISKISSISSKTTLSLWLSGMKASSLAWILFRWEGGCSVILLDFLKFFLLKDSTGENIMVFEGAPAWWAVNRDTWQTIFPHCSRNALCPAKGHSVKVEMLQLLENHFFDPLEQENVSTNPQRFSSCDCNLRNLFQWCSLTGIAKDQNTKC